MQCDPALSTQVGLRCLNASGVQVSVKYDNHARRDAGMVAIYGGVGSSAGFGVAKTYVAMRRESDPVPRSSQC